MADESNKWIDAVAKLIQLTQEGTLQWSIDRNASGLSKTPDDKIDFVYSAVYHNRKMRVFKRVFKDVRRAQRTLEDMFSIKGVLGADLENFWNSEVVLELLTDEGWAVGSFPKVDILAD